METLLPYALLCLTSIFTLANPLGTMPVFLTMTQGMSEEQRQSIVKRATITALIILIVFTFAGPASLSSCSSAYPPTASA